MEDKNEYPELFVGNVVRIPCGAVGLMPTVTNSGSLGGLPTRKVKPDELFIVKQRNPIKGGNATYFLESYAKDSEMISGYRFDRDLSALVCDKCKITFIAKEFWGSEYLGCQCNAT